MTNKTKNKKNISKVYLVFTGDLETFILGTSDYDMAENRASIYSENNEEDTCILEVTRMTNVLFPDPTPEIYSNADLAELINLSPE